MAQQSKNAPAPVRLVAVKTLEFSDGGEKAEGTSNPSDSSASDSLSDSDSASDSAFDSSGDNRSIAEKFSEIQHEITLMSSLNHPNIVQLVGICLENPPAVILEVMSGGELYQALNEPLGVFDKV